MKTLHRYALICFVASVLTGCANLAYLPGQKAIGTLRLYGQNVKVNHLPAINGQTIVSDDHISTGPDSSAALYFLSGGFIQFDENTDPGFKLVWEQTSCIFIVFKHLVGQVYEETSPQCSTKYQAPHGTWKNHGTKFNIQVNQFKSEMTVLDGAMELITPKQLLQGQGEQMVVTAAGVQSVRKLSVEGQKEVTKWRDRFPAPDEWQGAGSRGACQCAD